MKMRNFYEDFENVISEHSHGIIDAYNRGLVTIEETLATIMDYKRNADIAKAKAENSKPKRKTYFKPGADIPKTVRNKTYYNMKKYHMTLFWRGLTAPIRVCRTKKPFQNKKIIV